MTPRHVWGSWHTLPVNPLTRTKYSIIDSTWHGHTRSRYHERLSDGNKGYVALHIQYHHHTSIVSYQTQDRTNWLCRNLLEVVMIGARLDIRTERMKYFHWRIITPFFLSRDRRSVLRLGEAPVSRLLGEIMTSSWFKQWFNRDVTTHVKPCISHNQTMTTPSKHKSNLCIMRVCDFYSFYDNNTFNYISVIVLYAYIVTQINCYTENMCSIWLHLYVIL